MIKLFRNIRKKLLAEGSTGKYLKYAIGEIVLVVIGILIALQINTWNEQRKQNVNNVKFLKNLKNEIDLDTLVFSEKIISHKNINNNLKETFKLLISPKGINQKERQIVIESINNFAILTPTHKNSGRNDLKIMDGSLEEVDSALNKKYQQYLKNIKSNNDIVSKLGETLQLLAIQSLSTKIDLDYMELTETTVDFDFEELRKDRAFKNALNRSFKARKISISFMKKQKAQAKVLLKTLNKKLENK